MHSMFKTGFQCLRFTRQSLCSSTLRTGKTEGEVLSICLSSAQRVFEQRHWSPGPCKHSVFETGFQCLRFTRQSLCSSTLRTGKTDVRTSLSVTPALHAAFKRVFERRHWSPGLGKQSIYTTGFQCRVPRSDSEGSALERRAGMLVPHDTGVYL
jgi:hypothetical protein